MRKVNLQVSELFQTSFWGLAWPLVIIFLGIKILRKDAFNPIDQIKDQTSAENKINETTIFWGIDKKSPVKTF